MPHASHLGVQAVATEEMVAWAKDVTKSEVETLDQLKMLQRALFDSAVFPFKYDEKLARVGS